MGLSVARFGVRRPLNAMNTESRPPTTDEQNSTQPIAALRLGWWA